jgi:hypothetical protein
MEETLVSSNQRMLLFPVAAFVLGIGLQSLASAGEIIQTQQDNQKQAVERQKIRADEQPKTQKSVSPKLYQSTAKGAHIPTVTLETKTVPIGGSTGPTKLPLPTTGRHQ